MKYLFIFIFILTGAVTGRGQEISYAKKQIAGLEKVLKNYEKLNPDDWRYLTCDSCIKKGDKSTLVLLLKADLILTGDLLPEDKNENIIFDEQVQHSLSKFQKRNGLVADGILGPHTIEALNVPFSMRLQQIKDGIQQWKDFDNQIEEPYILVNLPDYTLNIIDSGRVIKNFRVIIGKQATTTPTFQNEIKYLVINPSWVVPYSIATNEILPMIQNDPQYLTRNHMEVYTFNRGSKIKVNADSIDWSNISASDFKYQIEQTPGPWNALGQIKFIFPNENSIYIHDTPEKYLFNHPIRTYSHGCIRTEKPVELASWLLKSNINEVKDLISKCQESTIVNLSEPVPVSVDYFTTWIGEDGSLQFREDVYNFHSSIKF